MSLFDTWISLDRVKVVHSQEELEDLVRACSSVGYWVADDIWLRRNDWNPGGVVRRDFLQREFSAGRFSVYGWPAFSKQVQALDLPIGCHLR